MPNSRSIVVTLVLLCVARPGYSDLVHLYTFDDEEATDSVGDLDGTIEGDPTFVEGVTGAAADQAINLNEFGGSNESILFEETEFGDQFSLTAWVKPSDELEQASFAMTVAASGIGGFTQPGFRWFVNTWAVDPPNGRIILEASDGSTGGAAATPDFVLEQDNEWHHVAITFDKELLEVALYHEGELITLGGLHDFPDEQTWRIGSFAAPQNGWIGAIDEFAVFDHVLDSDEVLDIFENGLGTSVLGDFNGNGMLDDGDIDLLTDEVLAGTNMPQFDLNSDDLVNSQDREVWVTAENIAYTYFGDSNLDDEFNSSDLVAVFTTGKYEFDADAGWAEGDWDGDKRFSSGDLVVAFTDGGYEIGARQAANAVPEPTSVLMLMVGLIGFAIGRRRTGP